MRFLKSQKPKLHKSSTSAAMKSVSPDMDLGVMLQPFFQSSPPQDSKAINVSALLHFFLFCILIMSQPCPVHVHQYWYYQW
mmetsp:Transcript_25704/g.69750  ORF Transcript_25704/g.69750 Transcript_25704/m.69750 type:complete len:81 (+) Transcript_25704:1441-1683(+)